MAKYHKLTGMDKEMFESTEGDWVKIEYKPIDQSITIRFPRFPGKYDRFVDNPNTENTPLKLLDRWITFVSNTVAACYKDHNALDPKEAIEMLADFINDNDAAPDEDDD